MSQGRSSFTVNTYDTREAAERAAKHYRETGRYTARVIKHPDETRYRLVLKSKT